jgi:hypothetical protein
MTTTFPSDGLEEFPPELQDDGALMPWEIAPECPVWPFGADRGIPIAELPTERLVSHRRWLEGFLGLIQAIDDVLTERGGE